MPGEQSARKLSGTQTTKEKMMLDATTALGLWGAMRIKARRGVDVIPGTVSVELIGESGSGGGCDTCDYGRDEGRVYVEVTGTDIKGRYQYIEISNYEFDFAQILSEILEVGENHEG